MIEINKSLVNFAGGLLSKKLLGRIDLQAYPLGASVLQNFFAEVQGPLSYRAGSRYVVPTRANGISSVIPFVFSDEQAYGLGFSDGKLRFFSDGGVITEDALSISNITKDNPGVITSMSHGLSDGDQVFISTIVGMTELNGAFYLVDNATTHTFTLTDLDGNAVDTSSFEAYVSGGQIERVYEIDSPYAEEDLFQLKTAQKADLMYIVHPDYAPYKLTRITETNWTLATFVRTADPFTGEGKFPAAVGFYGGRLMYGGTDDDPETFWGSRAPTDAGATRYDDFTTGSDEDHAIIFPIASQNDTADRIRWFSGTNKFLAVGTYGAVYKAFGDVESAPISGTSVNVLPVDYFGCASLAPVKVGTAIYYVQRGKLILNRFAYTFLSEGYVSDNLNLLSDELTKTGIKQLAVQEGPANIIWGAREDGVLLGITVQAQEKIAAWHTHILGGTDVKVLSVCGEAQDNDIDSLWVVVERTIDGVTRRYMEYFQAQPILPEFEDFFTGDFDDDNERFKKVQWETAKQLLHLDSALILDTKQGTTLTIDAVTGDSVLFTAGSPSFEAGDVGRQIVKKYVTGEESGIAEIVSVDSAYEVTCKILEDFDSTDVIALNNWYLTVSAISGLEHLEGEVVKVVVDGAVETDKTVVDGEIDLDNPGTVVQIGEGFRGRFTSMPVEAGGFRGPAQTRVMTINKLGILFRNSLGTKYGTNIYNLSQITTRTTNDYTDRPPPLFSGVKEENLKDGYSFQKFIHIVQDTPLPCTIQAIVPYVDVTNE